MPFKSKIAGMYKKQSPTGKRLVDIIGSAGAAAALVAGAMQWEGKSNTPYRDIVGVWTVCYGETNVQMRPYTDTECKTMLEENIAGYAEGVLERNPTLEGHPNQLVAATLLSYNIGVGAYKRSTVAKRFSAGNMRGACDAFLMWNKAGGKVVRGLTNRRNYERNICLKGI